MLKVYYIFRDYLGSITHIANSDGSLKAEYSYDAWGRLRNPATQVAYTPGSEPALFIGRGYTGHERLPWFGLVNMNARLYDAALGRFLSPDPYVQNPLMTQNYNRYTYAMNNPLVYIDEDGEWFFSFIFPGVGTYIDAFLWSATIEYFSQVLDNYMANKQGLTKYSDKDIWFGKIDWFDVGFAGAGALAGTHFSSAEKSIKYLSPIVTNAVNIYGDGSTEIIGKNIKAGDYLANTALEVGSLYITDIVREGLNTPSPNNILPEPNVPETIQDLISNAASSNISKTLQREWKYKDSPDIPLKNPPYKPSVPSIPLEMIIIKGLR